MSPKSNAEELFWRGQRLLEAGHNRDALRNLRASYEIDPDSPQCSSYLGLAVALAEKQFRNGEKLCYHAIRREFYRADFYFNLGRVFLAAGRKEEAVRAMKKGLQMDRTHDSIKEALSHLGFRKRPFIRFLPRDHFLNRGFGMIRTQLLPQARSRA